MRFAFLLVVVSALGCARATSAPTAKSQATAPSAEAPLGGAPLGSAPLGSAPLGSAPLGSAPLGSAPLGSAPLGSAPLGSAPLGSAPLTGTSGSTNKSAAQTSPSQGSGVSEDAGSGMALAQSPSASQSPPQKFVRDSARSQPFEGRESVSYLELVEEMRRLARALEVAPAVVAAHQELLTAYGLSAEELSIQSFSRVRLVFEATRDGGLWGIRWTITNQMPWSDQIWKQWQARDWSAEVPEITAQAECDELSAMFSFLARDLEEQGFVGLFWPTWNHTVAVWQVQRSSGSASVRILVPTSQVWLSREATLGTRELKTNRVVFPYARQDLKPDSPINGALARYLLGQLERYGAWTNEQLLERRNRLGGS